MNVERSRKWWMRVAVVAVVGGALTVASIRVIAAHSASVHPVDAVSPVTFRDVSGGPVISIQTALGRPDTGSFDFLVASVGDYSGVARVTGPEKDDKGSDHSLEIHGSNIPVTLHLADGTARPAAKLSIDGDIDPTLVTAKLDIEVGSKHYELETGDVQAGKAEEVAKQALDAIRTGKWAALYDLMSSDTTNNLTKAQFIAGFGTGSPGVITQATVTGRGQVTMDPSGYATAQVPFSAALRRANGTTTSYKGNVSLVLEKGTWRVLGTDPPPSPSP